MAGVSLKWNVFDGGRTKAEIQSAEAQHASALQNERKKRLEIELDIVKAQTNLTTIQKQLEQANKSVASAVKSLEITRARFADGLALATELIDAETMATTAKLTRVQAAAEEQIAIAYLRHASGLPILPTSNPNHP